MEIQKPDKGYVFQSLKKMDYKRFPARIFAYLVFGMFKILPLNYSILLVYTVFRCFLDSIRISTIISS